MRPDDYFWMCPVDLLAVSKGYENRTRGEWLRTVAVLRALGSDVSIEDFFGSDTHRTKITSHEDFNEFLQRFPSHRDGRSRSS